MNHVLKITEPYYRAVSDGRKTFEIRRNDRGFNAGDTIELIPWGKTHFTTGDNELNLPRLCGEITYVCNYEQKDNYVVFAFKLK